MKLQILVPQYKETEDTIINLLNSIAIQQGINLNDIEVLIMNDGTDIHLSDDFLSQYPFSIKYYLSDHIGVSGIRQALLNLATAEYIMFCDADDMFSSLLGINQIFNIIELQSPIDIIVPSFYQEIINPKNNNFNYIIKGDKDITGVDGIFVHGKVYRRAFLIENDIKWNKDLVLNEDSYFNTLALMLAKSVRYCNTPYYIWKFNSNSITRSDPNWNLHNYYTFIQSNIALIEEFEKRNLIDAVKLYVCQLLYNAYFTTNMPIWLLPQNNSYKNNIDNQLKAYIQKYGKYFEEASPEVKQKIHQNQRILKYKVDSFKITFENWYKKLSSN